MGGGIEKRELVIPAQRRAEDPENVDFIGNAQLLLTAPFFPNLELVDHSQVYKVPADGVLDPQGRIVRADRPTDPFLRGSLTYGNPSLDVLTHFEGGERFHAELAQIAQDAVGLPMRLEVTGILFPDGFGSVALRMEVADGWGSAQRERLIRGFGPQGRDSVAEQLRGVLLPALSEVVIRCRPHAPSGTLLPYFNLTYVAQTSHPRPGRGALPDDLRQLIYPRSPAPITSDSTWLEEFFYAGYAFLLLASAEPGQTLDQLEHLLLHLDVQYARMDQSAAAADRLIRSSTLDLDVEELVRLERRLRADYQALVRPTFSYNFHVLKLRDAILHAWETDKTRERADTLMDMARQAVQRNLDQEQARRVARVNIVVTILAILSFIGSLEAAVNLWMKWF
ncbi:hypothetical protein Rhe02_00510 [Rhizocola hellebori]|uniref:Uncharacterized protein n=1 Tax=Rhizocola hellebori TaxID=1392758 RepID=A0A8J3Q1Y0_9ACTN|nr:hypothetical protein Rhe02_00510 [Rhizocola hellebori]